MRAGELGINFWQIQNRSKSGKEAQVLSILTFNDLQMTPFKIKFLTLDLAKIWQPSSNFHWSLSFRKVRDQ
jgi:hypothetical protein